MAVSKTTMYWHFVHISAFCARVTIFCDWVDSKSVGLWESDWQIKQVHFNRIKHISMIQSVTKIENLNKKNLTDRIGNITKTLLLSECCNYMFANYNKMMNPTTFSVPVLCYFVLTRLKITHPHISFSGKPINTPNQYEAYYFTFANILRVK